MNTLVRFMFLFACSIIISNNVIAQVDSSATASKVYVIITVNGGEFIGTIVSQDTREVLLRTTDRGDISIPKYQIKEMKLLEAGNISATGGYIADQVFATRYVISTNGLPMEKGESYALFNLYGPEFHYGLTKNFSIGIMTSWVAIPIVASLKYSIQVGPKTHIGIGALLGTGSWVAPRFGLALPYATVTFGDRKNNLNFSYGYGQVWNDGESGGTTSFSIAGLARLGNKVSFVFDSIIIPNIGETNMALILPGLRFQSQDNKAFQFCFGGIVVDGNAAPVPFVQWFRIF